MASNFKYEPTEWMQFRDRKAIERARKIKREDLLKHKNNKIGKWRTQIVADQDLMPIFMNDICSRIIRASLTGEKCVLIMPNPCPPYRWVADLINRCGVNCKNVWLFAMDEYADEQGRIAPETWRQGFGWSLKNYLWANIDEKLRMPEKQVVLFTNKNLKDYGKMIEDHGNADQTYVGVGWAGHIAFVDPSPEYDGTLDEFMQMGPRLLTLSWQTIAQNSLCGDFGMSGDLAAVPPKAVTVGPKEIAACKNRMYLHSISVAGTTTSWQRLQARLSMFGPITPKNPASIMQLLDCDVYISENLAANIEPDWEKGY